LLLILMLLSRNIHKHLKSVLNELYHRQQITISRSGLVEWYMMGLCTVLQNLICVSGFATCLYRICFSELCLVFSKLTF
jgi:hypothetical protein